MDFEQHYIALGAEFIDMDDFLEHHGVKGMKWGVRKEEYKAMDRYSRKRQKIAYKMAKKKKRPSDPSKSTALKVLSTYGLRNYMGETMRLMKNVHNWDQVHNTPNYKEKLSKGQSFIDSLDLRTSTYDYVFGKKKHGTTPLHHSAF